MARVIAAIDEEVLYFRAAFASMHCPLPSSSFVLSLSINVLTIRSNTLCLISRRNLRVSNETIVIVWVDCARLCSYHVPSKEVWSTKSYTVAHHVTRYCIQPTCNLQTPQQPALIARLIAFKEEVYIVYQHPYGTVETSTVCVGC